MKKVFEQPNIMLESLQANDIVMNSLEADDWECLLLASSYSVD